MKVITQSLLCGSIALVFATGTLRAGSSTPEETATDQIIGGRVHLPPPFMGTDSNASGQEETDGRTRLTTSTSDYEIAE